MVSETIRSLKRKYKNQADVKIGRDLIQPCLKEAIKYRRGTGTFSSSAFKAYIGAIDNFINNDVKIEILCSPKIDLNLLRILEKCQPGAERDKILQKTTNDILLAAAGCRAAPDKIDYRSALLAYLIANDKLEIKIALPLNNSAVQIFDSPEDEELDMENVNTRAMYHIKYGYFLFPDKSVVAFEGSVNETDTALNFNSEKATVYRSWMPNDVERLNDVVEDLDNDWEGRNNDIRIYNIDEDSLKIIRDQASPERPKAPKFNTQKSNPNDQEDQVKTTSIGPPAGLRDYQKTALTMWAKNDFKGILAMATGTGKTLTAMNAVENFRKMVPSGFIVIVVPYQNLANQWIQAVQDSGMTAIAAFQSYKNWYDQFKNACLAATLSKTNAPCVVVVEDTFKSDRFQEMLGLLESIQEKNNLLIADECHHFNAPQHLTYLPTFFRYRLGLSATPYDQFSEPYLDSYFGKIVFEFTLKEAIKAGYLCPYDYFVVEASLNEQETEAYEIITRKIVQAIGSDEKITPENLFKVQPLLLQRARIVGAAKDKISKLKDLVISTGKQHYALVYCGDGSNDDEGEKSRQIDQVTHILHKLNWNIARVTAEETLDQRERTITALKNRLIDAIVSIRVLDEGIDIPSCRTAYFLASQRSERQHIQRRGRVLRLSEGKHKATLYDFVITGATSNSPAISSLIKRELERVWRFASDALNGDLTLNKFSDLALKVGYLVESPNDI